MKWVVNQLRLGLRCASIAIVFLLLLTIIMGGLIPRAYCYNFVEHSICKGWTEKGEPIVANKFNLTDKKVYLHLNISWANIEEYEQKWGPIPDMQRGLISAGSIEEFFQMKGFKISLKDPSQTEVNTFSQRKIHNVTCAPLGCISSGFLEILDITETTKNGRWKLEWYDGNTLIFTEEFVVGEETFGTPGSPGQSFLEILTPWIIATVVIIVVALVTIICVSRRKAKTTETSKGANP